MFGEVVSSIVAALIPINIYCFMGTMIGEPIEAHIPSFGSFLSDV